jgi:hypothetical protein
VSISIHGFQPLWLDHGQVIGMYKIQLSRGKMSD